MQKERTLSYTLRQLAELTQTQLKGNPDVPISGVEDLTSATPQDAAFLENPRYTQPMKQSAAGVIFVHPSTPLDPEKNYLLTETPSLAFQKVIELFIISPKSGFSGIHPTAVVHPDAVLGLNVTVGPYAVIDAKTKIGDRSFIGAHVSIGAEVSIGSDCMLHSHSIVREGCTLGNRVVLQPGAVIGSCGYGYFTDKKGNHHPLKQLGVVVLEDDVEIGANTTIDRARFKTTRVGKGSKIDNLVQIAHQVSVGENNLIVSQTGIAGSSKTGRNVVLAGQVGIVGHISIADGVILAARSAVSKSIEESGVYSGVPATPIREFNEHMVYVRNIRKMAKRLEALEKKLEEKEKQ